MCFMFLKVPLLVKLEGKREGRRMNLSQLMHLALTKLKEQSQVEQQLLKQ